MLVSREDLQASESQHLPFKADYFEIPKRYYFLDWKPVYNLPCALRSASQNEDLNSVIDARIGHLPDDCLREVLRHLHPVDRIQSASLVCRRWHRLLYAGGIWTDVVIRGSKDRVCAARNFINRVSSSLRRLCIYASFDHPSISAEAFGYLPDFAPKLRLLCFPATDVSYKDLVEIDRRMPALEELMGFLIVPACLEHNSMGLLAFVQKARIFRRMRRLMAFRSPNDADVLERSDLVQFCRERQVIEAYTTPGTLPVARTVGASEALRPLRKMTFDRCFESSIFPFLPNLTFLCLYHSRAFQPEPIRNLHSLDHLHLYYASAREADYVALFSAGVSESNFPHRLTRAFIFSESGITDAVLLQIATNCWNLRSLRLDRPERPYVPFSVGAFNCLARNLKKLEFFGFQDVSLIGLLKDDHLPLLRVLRLGRCAGIASATDEKQDEEVIEALQRRRPYMVTYYEQKAMILTFRWENSAMKFHWIGGEKVRTVCGELAAEDGACCLSVFMY